MVGSSSLSLFAALASFATGALATGGGGGCGNNKFSFSGPGFEICLPIGGPSNVQRPPCVISLSNMRLWRGH